MAEADGATALSISWPVPVNTGQPITDYDVQYREAGTSADFTDAEYTGTATEMRIDGLATGTSYEVQVRATSMDGTSPWSESGTGATADVAVEFGAEHYTATEGGSGVPVTVRLSPAAEERVTIAVTLTAATGTEMTDYAPTATQRLTFAVGESSKTIEVTANEDDDDSAEETVELGFDGALSEVGAGTVATATVRLADNDPLRVELKGPPGTVNGPFEVAIAFTEEVAGFEPEGWRG